MNMQAKKRIKKREQKKQDKIIDKTANNVIDRLPYIPGSYRKVSMVIGG